MSIQVTMNVTKLGKQVANSHTLLFADNGTPSDVNEPFAIAFSTQENGKVAPWSEQTGMKPPVQVSGARIGKILSGALPENFYYTHFKDMQEATEQVEYFFSLTETQRLRHFQVGHRSDDSLHSVRAALADYNTTFTALGAGGRISPAAMGKELLVAANKMLREVALKISPFVPGSPAFVDEGMAIGMPGVAALNEHVLGVRAAIQIFDREVNTAQLDRDGYTSAVGGLSQTIANMVEFTIRFSEFQEKRRAVSHPKGGF